MKSYDSIVRVGVDLAQSVVQLHAVDAAGNVVVAKQIQRSALIAWCEKLHEGCVVAFEACSAAHHLARQLSTKGLVPRLIAPCFVSPYRMTGATGKNDATDAEAICEAACKPRMRFVAVKTPDQQGWLAVHRLRDGYIKDRTAWMNRARSVLFEFGIMLPRASARFRDALQEAVSDRASGLPVNARPALRRCCAHLDELQQRKRVTEALWKPNHCMSTIADRARQGMVCT